MPIRLLLTTSLVLGSLLAAVPAQGAGSKNAGQPEPELDDDDDNDDDDDDDGNDDDNDDGNNDGNDDGNHDNGRAAEVRAKSRARASAGTAARAWGLGAVQTPSGLRGLELELYLRKLMVSAVLGFQRYAPEQGEPLLLFGVAAGAFYTLRESDRTALMVGGRGVIGYAKQQPVSATQLNLEAPLRLQWYLHRSLAIHFETGAVIALIPDNGEVIGSAPGEGRGKGFQITLGIPSLFGTAGMTLYF